MAQFPDSLLWKEASALTQTENPRLFIDRDGYTFRHVHYYLHSAKLSFSSCAELNLLYEQALLLQLTPLLQTLDNLKEGKHNLRVRPADIPIAERASLNYWRTRKCISKPSEFPLKSPAFTGSPDRVPLGLMDTPLLDTEEEVHYCFLPLELVKSYPSLVNDDNLLWLSDTTVLIESEGCEFRFIEKILLPDNFSNMDVLEAEAEALGIPDLTEAVKIYRNNPEVMPDLQSSVKDMSKKQQEGQESARGFPLYPLVLGLLVKYPDSALGQLHMESTLDGHKLYISGNGVLFQHIMNWLGTCRLPLIQNMLELPELCAYLDQMDITYEPMKDALKTYLEEKTPTHTIGKDTDWTAEIGLFSLHHIVKVYVGSHWYATYLKTLLKFPELLANCKKVYWIAYGQSLFIHGDGQIFRHILNFLRLGKLYLPSEFKEWSLLHQEVVEYQIPSLMEALCQCDTYRLWVRKRETHSEAFPTRSPEMAALEKEQGLGKDPRDHSCIVVDLNQHANPCRIIRETQTTGENDRESRRYTRISPAKGVKRKQNWEEYSQPAEIWGNSCSYKQLGSPPRKRGAKGNLTKKSESRETPIQKLISLVQGWDMVNCKRYDGQQVATSNDSNMQEGSSCKGQDRRASHYFGDTSPEISGNGPVIQAATRVQAKLPKARQSLLGASASEGWLVRVGESEEIHPMGGGLAAKVRSNQNAGEEQSQPVTHETLDNIGLILKVEHPLIVARDGSCASHEQSILYSMHLEDIRLAGAHPQPATTDTVFLSFPLSPEEIFYARKCHCFLTDIILDSMRQKDPKEMTAQVECLVQQLWTMQITGREFVAGLLSLEPFRANSPPACEKLLRWVEFTLPFAWKYSCCINVLIKKRYFKSLSYFVIGKYLQKT